MTDRRIISRLHTPASPKDRVGLHQRKEGQMIWQTIRRR